MWKWRKDVTRRLRVMNSTAFLLIVLSSLVIVGYLANTCRLESFLNYSYTCRLDKCWHLRGLITIETSSEDKVLGERLGSRLRRRVHARGLEALQKTELNWIELWNCEKDYSIVQFWSFQNEMLEKPQMGYESSRTFYVFSPPTERIQMNVRCESFPKKAFLSRSSHLSLPSFAITNCTTQVRWKLREAYKITETVSQPRKLSKSAFLWQQNFKIPHFPLQSFSPIFSSIRRTFNAFTLDSRDPKSTREKVQKWPKPKRSTLHTTNDIEVTSRKDGNGKCLKHASWHFSGWERWTDEKFRT